MKLFSSLKVTLALAALFLTTQMSFANTIIPEKKDLPPNWEKLGTRKVNYKAEKDVIMVTRWEGRFNAIKLKVEKSPVNVHRFVIFYRNGQKQEVKVRKKINAGGSTRVINLKGNSRRVINRVEFWYDTKGIQDKRAKVELWGRHV